MKISRNKPKQTISQSSAIDSGCNSIQETENVDVVVSPYEKAKDLIRQAIDELAVIAQDDNNAKDAIADLSVVLFEL